MNPGCSLAILLSLTACSDPLKEVSLVVDARVLGARVEVNGDPERASPAPGETVSVRWLVVAPEPNPPLGWVLFACAASARGVSLPDCAQPAFASETRTDPAAGEPQLNFEVPPEIDASDLLVYGSVCPGSAPVVEMQEPGCQTADGTLVSLDFAIADSAPNHNPSLTATDLSLDGSEWPGGSDCASLPSVAPGSRHTLELTLEDDDREPLEQEFSVDPTRETLQVSHFTTSGELERAFTLFGPDQALSGAQVSWQAPREAPADGVVRFFFVVRDLRGGAAWLERSVCVEP